MGIRVMINALASVFEMRCGSQTCRENLGTRGWYRSAMSLLLGLTLKATSQWPNDFLLYWGDSGCMVVLGMPAKS